MSSGGSIKKQAFSESLPRASIQDLGVILMGAGYEVFLTFNAIYFHDINIFPLSKKSLSMQYICPKIVVIAFLTCNNIYVLDMLQVFTKGPSLYAFKGLAGRYAPIGVHVAMIFVMAGATLCATWNFKGSVDVPQGLNFIM
jgi:cytochrome c biogenesis protein